MASAYRDIYKKMTTPQLITEAWETTTDPALRDKIFATLATRERAVGTEGGGDEAWPSGPMAAREEEAGLYPDPADPQFAARLYSKREFYEARAVAAAISEGTLDPCSSAAAERVFTLTPVQRIVSRFLHPLTPYMGMLLFHGVGVGKTCSAVTVAEQFLAAQPQNKVIVLVPQALKENFKRTIFNPDALTWDADAGQWEARQCTGTAYVDRLGLRQNPDRKTVLFRVEEDRRSRYTITGYQAFANWIERMLRKSLPSSLIDPAARHAAEDEVLRRLFSDHLIIVDEAHNLRDTEVEEGEAAAVAPEATTESAEGAAGAEAAENAGGKALNPYLRRICLNAEGLRLVLMTATPMYNSAPEIVLLLNYLLMNETKQEAAAMKVSALFTRDGELIPGAPQRRLERAARRYVSYMRGENPFTFPLRMRPLEAVEQLWPTVSATAKPVILSDHEKMALAALPLVFTEPIAGSPPERVLRGATARAAQMPIEGEEVEAEESDEGEVEVIAGQDAMLDLRMQMANITYPNELVGGAGWDAYFTSAIQRGGDHRLRTVTPRDVGDGTGIWNIDSIFAGEGLRTHAPKFYRVVESVRKARGICFAYSRYIKAGALPLAIAFERAGFQRRLADGRIAPLLTGVPPAPPVCALCGERSGAGHAGDHPFRPAYYVLLTSEEDLSPKFAGLVRQAASWPAEDEWGPLGTNVKVVIGSQVASEGLDLKCVREMHVVDAWYHLNRTDQIIGRAIRYCSHTALRPIEARLGLPAMSLNNTLIYLHALSVPDREGLTGFETADQYAIRVAIRKALAVGRVQRLLKRHAWDCALEMEAITFAGLPPRSQIDAQGNDRRSRNEAGEELAGYSPNDVDYTTYCDYERCRHECAVKVAASPDLHLDTSTYTAADARRLILQKQDLVRRLFQEQVVVPETVVQDVFSDLPWEIASEALMELLDGRRFRLTRPDGVEGFLVKKAGLLVFQPMAVTNTEIPLALRYARAFQLRRRWATPTLPVFARAEEPAVPGPIDTMPAIGPAAAAAAATEPVAPPPSAAILGDWAAWVAWVVGGGKAALPATVSSTHRLWSWLLQRYAAVPEVSDVAFRWWFDRCRYADQRALLEAALSTASDDVAMVALQRIVRPDVMRATQLVAYRVYNPATMTVEFFCRSAAAGATGGFSPCDSKIAAIVERELTTPPVDAMKGTGTLFGFLMGKKGDVVFKTLDKTQPIKPSSVGAECGNTSNLSVHHPRVRVLHAAGRATDLAPLMLPDTDETWAAEGADKRKRDGTPQHMKDITHQPLCLYMEFLCRILDARAAEGKRWFFSAAAAQAVGLRGKQ